MERPFINYVNYVFPQITHDQFVGWLLLSLVGLVVDITPRVSKSPIAANVVKGTAIICLLKVSNIE